jgi:hypothetical protein
MHIPAVASLWASLPDAPLDAPPAEFSHAPLQLTRGLACGGIQRTYEAECGGKTDKKRAKRQKKKSNTPGSKAMRGRVWARGVHRLAGRPQQAATVVGTALATPATANVDQTSTRTMLE